MKILPDDPRITAYALGQIDDPEENKVIKAAVKDSPELQTAVAEIRSIEAALTAGLAAEPKPELSELEQARLEAKPTEATQNKHLLLRYWPQILSLAAVLAIAAVLLPREYTEKQSMALDYPQSQSQPERDEASAAKMKADDMAVLGMDQDLSVDSRKRFSVAVASRAIVAEPELSETQPVLTGKTKVSAVVEAKPAPVVSGNVQPQRVEADRMIVSQFNVSTSSEFSDESKLTPVTAQSSLVDRESNSAMRGMIAPPASVKAEWNTERYDSIEETGFRSPRVAPLSTFSIDVDTASYANVRRYLMQGQLPPADAVRVEELINYFPYADTPPAIALEDGGDPFAVHLEQATAPWNIAHRLVRIGIKGYEMPWESRPASNLVFLLDVSGSMTSANKLPLVKEAMQLLVERLDERDRVAVVVYAGASGLALPSTTANNHETIRHAMANLKAGGSTNGGAGIQLAYKVAREHFIEDGNNRVILCTDGDFNVGQTNRSDLTDMAAQAADDGVSLTILGFGMGNLNDHLLEDLSQKGKGSYAYIDTQDEARKVFLEDLTSNLFKIAKDVKIQVEFNPSEVSAYRLIGYENRRLKAEDFNNDAKKAGDIGPGHSIVALYEVIPAEVAIEMPDVDPLRYQSTEVKDPRFGELATIKLRYKQPEGSVSQLIERSLSADSFERFVQASDDFRFSAAVAAFGLKLRQSEGLEAYDYEHIRRSAMDSLGADPGGHRSEFVDLVGRASELAKED